MRLLWTWNPKWSAFALHLLVGVLYVFGGFMLMDEPVQGSVIITIFVAVALIIGGVLRMVIGVRYRPAPGWALLVLGGVISLLIGAMLYAMLPWSGLWVVGTLIAVELVIHGISWIQFGLALRHRT